MDKLPRIPSPPGTQWREFRVTLLPFVVFALVLTLTIFTWRNYVGPSALVGEVEAVRASVNSPQTGRLMQLSVQLMERVSKGQVLGHVAVSDPRVIEANVALSKARLALIRTTPVPEQRLENNHISYVKLRLDWLDQRTQLAAVRARTNYLEGQLDRVRRFYEALGTNGIVNRLDPSPAGFSSLADVQLAEANLAEARAQILERSRLIADIEGALTTLAPESAKNTDGLPSFLNATLAVEERNLALLEAQLAPQPLISPIDGIVSTILHHEGEGVPAGQPVLTVSGITADRIIAYVRQPLNFAVRTNLAVEVRARSYKRKVAVGSILSVGRQLEAIQPQLLPLKPMNGATIEYGLPILVSVPKGMTVLPGEIVDLRPLTD